jgi:hypothetical protein
MSRQELVTAFLDGQISRRTLIRRLVAGGVSTGAAISYAHLLAPERAGASTAAAVVDDHYPLVDMKITSTSLAQLRTSNRIAISVTCTEELRNAFFRVLLKTADGGVPLGSRFFTAFLFAAGSRDTVIDINPAPFASRTRARFYVQVQAQDAEFRPALASTFKTLS